MNTPLLQLLQSDKYYSLADSALNSLFRFAAGIALARLAGAETFASYILLVTAQMTLMSFIATCCDTPLLNTASGLKPLERDSLIHWTSQRSQKIRVAIAAFAIVLFPLTRHFQVDTLIYFGFVLSTIAAISAQFQRARLQTLYQMKRALIADIVFLLIVIVSTAAAWNYAHNASLGFWWGAALGFYVASQIMAHKSPIGPSTISFPVLQEKALQSGRSMLTGSLANAACSRFHPYLISLTTSAAAVASYGAAWTVLGPLRLATVALSNILRPRLAAHHGKEKTRAFAQLLRNARFLIIILGALLALFFLTVGPSLIQIVFGPQIQATSFLLVLAITYATLDAYTTTQMIQLQIQKEEGSRQASHYRIIAALISLVSILPALYLFGLTGTFLSLLLAEATYATLANHTLKTRAESYPVTEFRRI